MKRFIYRLIVGLITFTVGLCLSLIWKPSHDKLDIASQINISSTQIQASEPRVTVCEIDSHPELYLGKRIRLSGVAGAIFEKVPVYCSGKRSEITITLNKNQKPTYDPPGENPCICNLVLVDVIGYLEPKVEKVNSQHHYHVSDARIVMVRDCFH